MLSVIRQSPGIRSPALNRTRSPGTTSCMGISCSRPSRTTVAWTWTRASSLATASEAPRSCQKPRRPLIPTMAKMIRASVVSRRNRERPAAKSRIRMMGLLNWERKRRRSLRRRSLESVRPGTHCRRAAASAAESPKGVVCSSRISSSAGRLHQAASRCFHSPLRLPVRSVFTRGHFPAGEP